MKYLIITLFTAAGAAPAFCQVENGGFETVEKNQPVGWFVQSQPGFTNAVDSTVYYSGTRSFSISSEAEKKTFQSFSQTVPVATDRLKKITISALLKTNQVSSNASIWCQVWNDTKQIDFFNLAMQGQTVSGTNDWKEYAISFAVRPEAKKLVLGGLLSGTGTTWFDDFSVKEVSAAAGKPAADLIKEVRGLIQQNALYSDSLNWKQIDETVEVISRGLQTTEDTKPVINYLLAQLRKAGDHHSFHMSVTASKSYTRPAAKLEDASGRLLPGNIGYISVPGFGSTNDSAMTVFAQNIQNLVKKLDTENPVSGWIIDLRKNTGGNMYPMIAGLGPFLNRGTLGYFVRGRNKKPWFFSGGGNKAWSGGAVVPEAYTIKERKNKIALLIGPMTASSGEFTTISFIGQAHTKLFGQPTAGYTTANSMFPLSDGSSLALATTYAADRKKNTHIGRIMPDVLVTPSKDKDADVEAAANWILEK
ncbi:S41 family peptidase [Niabella sp. CC-SYL272]|uniref:S41 family peptidase n=1 Tax=Niabella agricola TaxID=2891571 RepID=UPI001F38C579|nr:S41 family peptidase [Niabella agricola]MCF3110745.1 S41 family peptidase [Niabella agricola]